MADIDVAKLITYHRSHKRLATVSAVRPPARFGALEMDDNDLVTAFQEKPVGDNSYINGGYFVLSPRVLDYVPDDATPWEREPLERLAAENQLKAFRHDGFWQPMDTLRDKQYLDGLWETGAAQWKVWK